MSLIDDIRKDREAGTPGPWSLHDANSFDGRATYHYEEVWSERCDVICEEVYRAHGDGGHANMRRIARVPDMEAALIAAEKMAELLDEVQRQGCEVCSGDCASATPPVGYCPMQNRARALEAYRAATKGGAA